MSDQNREEQPEPIPAPEPVVDSAFDAIPQDAPQPPEASDPVAPPAPTVDPSAPAAAAPPATPDAHLPPVAPPPPQVAPGVGPAHGGYPAAPGAATGHAAPGQPGAYPGAPGGYPGQPGAYPGGAPGNTYPAYPGQAYGAQQGAPTARPRFVMSACVLAWVIAALGAIGIVATLVLLTQYPGIDGAYVAGALLIPILTIVGLVVFAVFTWQGKAWARVGLTAMFALNTIAGLANVGNGVPQAILGVLLSVLGIVLLWLGPSNAWFRAQRQTS